VPDGVQFIQVQLFAECCCGRWMAGRIMCCTAVSSAHANQLLLPRLQKKRLWTWAWLVSLALYEVPDFCLYANPARIRAIKINNCMLSLLHFYILLVFRQGKGTGKGRVTCYSASYMICDQKHYNFGVAADWHELNDTAGYYAAIHCPR